MLYEFTHEPRIAYFSMEIALHNEIPTYAGGLGMLAGDTLRSAADLHLPLVGVTLVSRAGYLRQEIDAQGHQIEHPSPWEPRDFAQSLDAKVALPIEGRAVWIGAWLYVLEGHGGGRVFPAAEAGPLPEKEARRPDPDHRQSPGARRVSLHGPDHRARQRDGDGRQAPVVEPAVEPRTLQPRSSLRTGPRGRC